MVTTQIILVGMETVVDLLGVLVKLDKVVVVVVMLLHILVVEAVSVGPRKPKHKHGNHHRAQC